MSELRTRLELVARPAERSAPREATTPLGPGQDDPDRNATAARARTRLASTRHQRIADRLAPTWGTLVVLGLALAWAAEFGYLAVQRHLAGGSHAEDLGFTDQVLANFLRGQFFRLSIYRGATWNTELDISRLARPDSLLAFHFEPMLLLLVPLYVAGGGVVALLIVQALAVAAGALPAYRLGAYTAGSIPGGVAVASAYLLSPLGQWAVLADFHTSTLAAPLLVLAIERLVVRHSAVQALALAALAATAREDVGLAIGALGLVLVLRNQSWFWLQPLSSPPYAAARLSSDELSVTTKRHGERHAKAAKRHAGVMATSQNRQLGLGVLGLGLGSTLLAALVLHSYSGGVSPFDVRYGATLGAGPGAAVAALGRPIVLGYLGTLTLSGGWLGLLSPLALLPALPALALNVLSTSPWMAAGKAHYSALVLPFITLGAAAGLLRLRGRPALRRIAIGALALTSTIGYILEGAGPLGGNYAPAVVTTHALRAEALASSLPANAVVSASSALVPRISRRPGVYVFPAVLDAEYVFLDLHASPAPTSAGDTFLRVRTLLTDGGWTLDTADDGLLLLRRAPDAPPMDIAALPGMQQHADGPALPLGTFLDGKVTLLAATVVPSPDATVDIDGPRGLLHTVWRAEQPLPAGTHLDFWLDLRDGQRLHVWDIAPLWWDPPERWSPGESVVVDVPDVSMHQFQSWQATWTAQ